MLRRAYVATRGGGRTATVQESDKDAGTGTVCATLLITHAGGLHARPSARVVGALRREANLDALLEFECEGRVASARISEIRPTALLRLKVRRGDAVRVVARGPDAKRALAIVVCVLQEQTGTHEDAFTAEVFEALLEEFGSLRTIRAWTWLGMR